jgi:hypothetical protein
LVTGGPNRNGGLPLHFPIASKHHARIVAAGRNRRTCGRGDVEIRARNDAQYTRTDSLSGPNSEGQILMAKAELGAKRRCLTCEALFYDLNRVPIVCPKCAAAFQVVEIVRSAPKRAPFPRAGFSRPTSVAPESADGVSSTEHAEDG